jgi:hypothetical protein
MLCADMLEVCWRERSGKERRTTAILEDISTSGACLQLETPAPLGVEIGWRSSKHEFTGIVRYCVFREIGYFVGVEFGAESKWSKQAYQPQHFLDLKKLM